MPNLYVITGPAGIGKTTISKKLAQNKPKSVLIEGDEIYSQVVGSYVSAWKEGNHLDLFWKICLDMIDTYLLAGYDVIFNYIVTLNSYNKIKERFKKYNTKFVVLIANEEIILKRDKNRPEDCQMNERCIVLLNNFKNTNYEKDYFLDTTNLSIQETINAIENIDRFLI